MTGNFLLELLKKIEVELKNEDTMKKLKILLFLLTIGIACLAKSTNNRHTKTDSINSIFLKEHKQALTEIEQQTIIDSIKKSKLERELLQLKTRDNLKREKLIKALSIIEENENKLKTEKKAHIEALRQKAKGSPVIGVLNDTLFFIYSRIGAFTAAERANSISLKIERLYNDDFLKPDSIQVVGTENNYDIVYGETIIMTISETDAIWYGKENQELALSFKEIIKTDIVKGKAENSWTKLLFRIGLVLLVIIIAWLIIKILQRNYNKLILFLVENKNQWIKDLSYKNYTFLSAKQEMQAVLFSLKTLKWFIYLLLLYISLPIIFSIFPFSRTWADSLFNLIWTPFKSVLVSVWNYLPNLFSILVIYFVMKYVIQFVRYIFSEIENEKLVLSGFHADWAMPTYNIVRFLLIAFMFVLIFPYLPGSDSNIFKGVSVFIGVLFSLGSSSAIANMVAGFVITYMRPFKIGDRIKIGDVTGDVIEKTLLVTRIKTPKNEIITIPNGAILNGNTTNYSSEASKNGLIIHSTVTIGYDVPWPKMHEALIVAATETEFLLSEPKPFVLQTSLDDFYVSYQINAYTHEASKQALIYSCLHQNIQDTCKEMGIEIMSPHYRAERDGNASTIPTE